MCFLRDLLRGDDSREEIERLTARNIELHEALDKLLKITKHQNAQLELLHVCEYECDACGHVESPAFKPEEFEKIERAAEAYVVSGGDYGAAREAFGPYVSKFSVGQTTPDCESQPRRRKAG